MDVFFYLYLVAILEGDGLNSAVSGSVELRGVLVNYPSVH